MRRLRFVVGTKRGALPALLAVSVLAGGACGDTSSDAEQNGSAGTAGSGGSGVSVVGGAGGTVIIVPDAGPGGSGPGPFPDYCREDYVVELPEEGVPAEPGQICSQNVGAVDSNRAARVEFVAAAAAFNQAGGTIEIAAALRDSVVGTPLVEVIDASPPGFLAIDVTNMTASATGFTFDASWPDDVYFENGVTRMTVQVTLELDCDGSAMSVHAVTDVHLCIDGNDLVWVSSGDTCTVCRIIAEMAPSPIVPDKQADDLPLAQALRLRIVELARVSNTIVLLAENDGGEGLEYDWQPSVGTIERLAPDVVVWTLAEGMPSPLIQAAVWGANGAAVASFGFNDEAA